MTSTGFFTIRDDLQNVKTTTTDWQVNNFIVKLGHWEFDFSSSKMTTFDWPVSVRMKLKYVI